MVKYKIFKNVVCNVLIGLVIVAVLVVSFGGMTVPVSGNVKAIYKGESQKNVSLMVNVYWGTEYIDTRLDIFEKNDVKTTFFVGGSWAAANENTLKKIFAKGHEIGNHGYWHKEHDKISRQRNVEEISITHQLIKSILGVEMNLFAPPSGAFDSTTLEVANELGYKTIMWTNDTIDWRDKYEELIFRRATKNLKGGNLILMHPTLATVDALGDIIAAIKKKGLSVAPVSQCLGGQIV
jgi:peptidoglycan/xylan/chitin deacetylase (PgdA/CDA1 family)